MPQTRASINPAGGKQFAPTQSMEAARPSALPMRLAPPTPVVGSMSTAAPRSLQSSPSSPPVRPVLCHGLVVPESCECVLLLPELVRESGSGGVMINDINGIPVLKTVYAFPPNWVSAPTSLSLPSPTSASGRGSEEMKPCLMLLTLTEDESAFASCREGLVGSLVIQDGSNRPFGSIRPHSEKAGIAFEILTNTGLQMHISEELSITDRENRVVALTEPSQSGRRLVRIGPFTDAGLVVLAILATDLLKSGSVQRGL